MDHASPSEQTIREVGALIAKQIREVDVATHFDGFFAMILSRTGAELARTAAERVRTAVEEASGGATTVSVGLASFPEDGLDREAIAAKAADAYFQAVAAGGDSVRYPERQMRKASRDKPRVLLVDDDPRDLKLLSAQLGPLGYEVLTAASGAEALGLVQGIDVDLVILDVMIRG